MFLIKTEEKRNFFAGCVYTHTMHMKPDRNVPAFNITVVDKGNNITKPTWTPTASIQVATAVWVPLGLSVSIITLVCLMICAAKARKRRRRGDRRYSEDITTVSGTVGMNVNAYRNYDLHTSRQTLNLSISDVTMTTSSACLVPNRHSDASLSSDRRCSLGGTSSQDKDEPLDNKIFKELHNKLAQIQDTPPTAKKEKHTS